MRSFAALIVILAATGAMAGDIYKWKDAGGKMHYSDAPPPGVDAQKTGVSAAPPADNAADQRRRLAEQDAEYRKRKAEADKALAKADADKAQAEKRAKACEDARRQLTALESGQRIARYNDKGERAFLDDGEREAATRDARQMVQDACQ